MLYFLILLAFLGLGFALLKWGHYELEVLGFIFVTFTGVVLFFSLVAWPFEYMARGAKLQHIEMVRQVAQEGRFEESYEGVAFRMKIAELNGWLAEQRYWNQTIFHLYVPDAVETTEPISAKTGEKQ